MRNGAEPAKMTPKLPQLALSLRAKCVHELQVDKEWQETWTVDPDCTLTTEAGEIPRSVDEYVVACARPRKWMDPWLGQAAAKVLQSDILVFKYLPKHGWKFLERLFVDRERTLWCFSLKTAIFSLLIRPSHCRRSGRP